jgi:hypothetical protein
LNIIFPHNKIAHPKNRSGNDSYTNINRKYIETMMKTMNKQNCKRIKQSKKDADSECSDFD